jgi:hypothetical protein
MPKIRIEIETATESAKKNEKPSGSAKDRRRGKERGNGSATEIGIANESERGSARGRRRGRRRGKEKERGKERGRGKDATVREGSRHQRGEIDAPMTDEIIETDALWTLDATRPPTEVIIKIKLFI